MLKLPPNFGDRLLDVLLEIPAMQNQQNRDMLLRNLPKGPANSIPRDSAPLTDLNNIIAATEGWGQLIDSGEWALVIIARNALIFAKGTDLGRKIDALLANIETLPKSISQEPLPEIVIGRDERLPVDFLKKGLIASKSVARVLVPRIFNGVVQNQSASGTGWLISPNLFITNHHVIEARSPEEMHTTELEFNAQALKTRVWFDYVAPEEKHYEYGCLELVHSDQRLDYALLRISSMAEMDTPKPLSTWGFLSFPRFAPNLSREDRLNIIQHPQGGPQKIAIRSNYYVDSISTNTMPHRIRYLTDTEPGSSGSPVFDDNWSVIALHHMAVEVNQEFYKGKTIKYNNQGILIQAILKNLPDDIQHEIEKAQKWE
jgi:V8-like Glu-specific endopeptidase